MKRRRYKKYGRRRFLGAVKRKGGYNGHRIKGHPFWKH